MARRRRRVLAVVAAWLSAALVSPPAARGAPAPGVVEPSEGTGPVHDRSEHGCIDAEGRDVMGSGVLEDGPRRARVEVEPLSGCLRRYVMSSTVRLREGEPANPRVVDEVAGAPYVRTHNRLLDAVYALALAEMRENSVSSIHDPAFDHGAGIPCPPGGCFETGRKWHYVWTRDTAYAVALGLGALDPVRALNSLAFKTSERRGGGGREIVQDTGTGGSWPMSTDRSVWALGAAELLKYLRGPERRRFADLAWDAAVGTIEHDRRVVFDPDDGLYRGEESFLDWREQSYPAWAADDPAQIGMSKALGTNVGHHALLELASRLAGERGDTRAAARYRGFADELAKAIRARFRLDDGSYGSFIPGVFDPAASRRSDLLSSALVVLEGLGQPAELARVVATYPHLERGAPVIWPQQQDTPIYHNRAVWPFATAFWLRAAREVDNAAAVDNGVRSLVRIAALNLSCMENVEMVSGDAWVDDGPYSGPVVDSQRQLWSIAAMVSMVHDVFFGLEASADGIRFRPYVTKELRHTLLEESDSLVLAGFPYAGRRITVVVHLPPRSGDRTGAYAVGRVEVNGVERGDAFLRPSELDADSRVDVTLVDRPGRSASIRLVRDPETRNPHALYAPRTPVVTEAAVSRDGVALHLDLAGEPPDGVSLSVYRDGVRVARHLPGSTSVWRDAAGAESRMHCYTAESVYRDSGNVSQRAKPVCVWGPGGGGVITFAARDPSRGSEERAAVRSGESDRDERRDGPWSFAVVAPRSGRYLVQALAANGAGPLTSGVACGVKLVELQDEAGGSRQTGYLAMPQLGTWDRRAGSTLVPVRLEAGRRYRLVVRDDELAVNMSAFEHFARFTGGTGGAEGPYDRVALAELVLVWVGP